MQRQFNKQKRSSEGSAELAAVELPAGASRLRYSLQQQRGPGVHGGPGWVESVVRGELRGAVRRVAASEAYAMAAQEGCESVVVRATVALASLLERRSHRGREQAERLRSELQAGLRGDRVPLDRLQEAALRAVASGTPLSLIAERAGLGRGCGKPDVTALERMLGLAPTTSGTWARTVAYADGVRLARALDLDPVEAGV